MIAEILSKGLPEGDFSWMEGEPIEARDDLVLARDFARLSPAQLLERLLTQRYIRVTENIVVSSQQDSLSIDWRNFAESCFPGWESKDHTRFTQAKEKMNQEDPRVVTCLGELVNPFNQGESRNVMFIAAGGVNEGLVTARGVYQMKKAMEEAQNLGVPIIFFNAITSADPSFDSEVGQTSRQISETMTLGLRLTVPKITVITGEAASAGAHAAWQIADRTLIFDRGALLTVINIEEALNLLHFGPEIAAEANRRFLETLGFPLENTRISIMMQGAV